MEVDRKQGIEIKRDRQFGCTVRLMCQGDHGPDHILNTLIVILHSIQKYQMYKLIAQREGRAAIFYKILHVKKNIFT